MATYLGSSGSYDSGIPTRDHGYSDFLYQRLPQIYREKDREMNQSLPTVESLLPNLDTSKVASDVRPMYQLQRFLHLFGSAFNCAQTSIDSTLLLLDLDTVEAKWLPYISTILGWKLNLELDTASQRKELKNAVNIYQRKGRQEVIEFMVAQFAPDYDLEIKFSRDRLFVWVSDEPECSHNNGSHWIDTDSPTEVPSIGTKDDEVYYFWGQQDSDPSRIYCVQCVFLYLTQNDLDSQSSILTPKLTRLADEFAPWGVVFITVTDSLYAEPDFDIQSQISDDIFQEEAWTEYSPWFWWYDPAFSAQDYRRGTTWHDPDPLSSTYTPSLRLWRMAYPSVVAIEEWETDVT